LGWYKKRRNVDIILPKAESVIIGELIMRIKTTLNVTLLAILVSIFVQACSGTGTSTASSTSRIAFSIETSIEVDELEIKSEMSSNILRIKKMSLDSGRLVFKLSSPDGRIQWEEAFTAPADYQHTFDLDVTPGIWKLEIELENATGNYDIQWRASKG
jgi:hypothetical protein